MSYLFNPLTGKWGASVLPLGSLAVVTETLGSTDNSVLLTNGVAGTTAKGSPVIVSNSGVVTGAAGNELNVKTDSYTLILSDAGKSIILNKATAVTLTIPANASVAFPIGTIINIAQLGAGQVTVGITSDTLRSSGNKTKLAAQYSGATLCKVAATEWLLTGDIVV